MSQQQHQLNQPKNDLDESIQLKEENNNIQTQGQLNNQQQSLSSLNGKKIRARGYSQTPKNGNSNAVGAGKPAYGKTFSRQLSRVNSIEDFSNSQQRQPISDKFGTSNAMSLKALSKQKTLLEKQQKLMEELIKKKNPNATKDFSSGVAQKLRSQMVSRRGSVIQGKRGSRILNPNLMAALRQKIQEEEDKQKYTLKYRLGQISQRIKSYDNHFHIVQLVVLIIFFIEIILLSFCKKGYFLSFTFFMDLVSTVSLLFDIQFLTQLIFGTSIDSNSVSALKASRVSRIASRSTKIVRFIRLLRLTKLQKVYQKAYETLNEKYNHKDEEQEDSESSLIKDGRLSNPQTSQQNLDFMTEKQNQSYGQNHSDFQLKLKNSDFRDVQQPNAPFRKRMDSFEKIRNTRVNTVIKNFYRRRSLDIKDTSQPRGSAFSYMQNANNSSQIINGKKNTITKYGSNYNIDSGNFSAQNLNTLHNQPMITQNSPKKRPLDRKSILSHISHGTNASHDTQNQNLGGIMSMKRDSVKQSGFYNSARYLQIGGGVMQSSNINAIKAISFINPGFENHQRQRPSELQAHPSKSKVSLNSSSSFGFDDDQSQDEQTKVQAPKLKSSESESKIGQRLADITTNRVIILIFVLVVCIPFFDETNYLSNDIGFGTYLDFVVSDYTSAKSSYDIEKKIIIKLGMEYDPNEEKYRYPLNKLILEDVQVFPNPDQSPNTSYTDLRDDEFISFSSDTGEESTEDLKFYSEYILKIDQDLSAYLSIGQTTFIIVLLAYSTISLVKDVNKLVVSPIERMLENIKLIADNPLNAAKISEEKAMAEQELKKNRIKYLEMSQQKNDETYLLESTIMKIGALLAIGFGEAGSKIITKNMQVGGRIDPMIPGKKVMAIFGFASIKNFADATEILQEKVMIFANEVAELVHVCCDSFHGAVNKNLGDCFLLVWKFTEDESQLFLDDNTVKVKNLPLVQNLADLPVVAFIKAIANARLLSLTPNFIQQHLKPLQKVMSEFKLRLGFGLHIGWGIEGAIGSNFKIDASYLSPNVNMASRLENATKQYGLYFLLSGSLYRILSPKTQSALRHVDRVTVKGSKQPMDLYTCDVDPTLLTENKFIQKRQQDTKVNKKVLKFISRKRRTERYKKIINGQANISSILDSDIDISLMRSNYTDEFRNTYHEGLTEYFNGDWESAREIFKEAQLILEETLCKPGGNAQFLDGPIQTLTNYMAKFNFKAPHNWFGYRVLVDK